MMALVRGSIFGHSGGWWWHVVVEIYFFKLIGFLVQFPEEKHRRWQCQLAIRSFFPSIPGSHTVAFPFRELAESLQDFFSAPNTPRFAGKLG